MYPTYSTYPTPMMLYKALGYMAGVELFGGFWYCLILRLCIAQVPQNAVDELSSVLLERIYDERLT